MPKPSSTFPATGQPRRPRRASLASRIAAARLVAEKYRELARIAGKGSHHHARMLARARSWQALARRLTRQQQTPLPDHFTLSAS